ncbi:MAG: hypothetical protein J6C96_04925 [Oscillospiraceae bacterium]|nr:hypothetical protein [Oscillospiraceae bacterium]
MKKLIYIPLAAVMLTACAAENNVPENTTTVVETTVPTTALTLTESLTTEIITEPVEEIQPIELAVYNPFADAVKVDDETYKEIAVSVEKISDGRAILSANPSGFDSKSKCVLYSDTENILEKSEEFEYAFVPINPEIAKTENELKQYLRGIFTEDYISDEGLEEALFTPSEYDSQPSYKTIDGTLCIKQQYNGVMAGIDFSEVSIAEFDGNTATAVAYGYGVAYPPYRFTMKLVKSEEYGWRLDSVDAKEYYENEAQLLYNAVSLREDALNAVLGGGNVPENARKITVDGEAYTETDTGMTLEEMCGFFEITFREYEFNPDWTDGASLRGKYIEKYIYDVYCEQDGVLYRKDSAPKWYLPELKIDPYGIMEQSGGGYQVDSYFIISQPFYDYVKESELRTKLTIVYADDHSGNYQKLDYLYIASELPITKLE